MKRLIAITAVLVFVLTAVPAFAAAPRAVLVVSDVIKMSKAGVGDDEIIAFVHKTREPFDISGDDVIAMTDAAVSKAVIKAVIDEAASDRNTRNRRQTVYEPRVVAPYWYGYDPYWYGYDPFWYGPRVGFSIGIGVGRGHYRGHYRHGRWR